jgi:Peptidase family M23
MTDTKVAVSPQLHAKPHGTPQERGFEGHGKAFTIAGAISVLLLMGTCTVGRMSQTGAGQANAAPKTDGGSLPAPKSAQPKLPPVPFRGDFILSGDVAQGGLLRGQVPSNTTSLLLNGEQIPFTADGFFLIGLDRDAPATGKLEAWRGTGEPVIRMLEVLPSQWRIQRVDVGFNGPSTSSEYASKRPAEIAEMAESRKIKVDSDGWRQQFIWPVTGRISGVFGSQRIYRGTPGNYHNGVDVAVPIGTPLKAPADGVVVLAADRAFTLEGYLLIIDHGMGLVSTFLHNNKLHVKKGDAVKQGQLIADVGTTGRSTGPHMHWGMRWKDSRIDPMRVAGPMPRVGQAAVVSKPAVPAPAAPKTPK